MKNLSLCSCFMFCLMSVAWADSCPSTYPVLRGNQCCSTRCGGLSCGPETCVAPTPAPPLASPQSVLSNATVKYVPVPIDDGISVVIPVEKNLPKDPGVAGDATVVGSITNPYGVRDDVMRGIVYAYPKNPKAQTVLFNMAKNYQTILANSGNSAIVLQNMAANGAWAQCLSAVTDDDDVSNTVLRPLMLDTMDRSLAYVAALQSIEGIVTIPDVTVPCP